MKTKALTAIVFSAGIITSVPVFAEPDLDRYDLSEGRQIYNTACMTCHETGVAGAPRVGEHAVWEDRIEQGMETLIRRSLDGYRGESGFMPPRGGYSSLTDEEVAAAVAYMVSRSR